MWLLVGDVLGPECPFASAALLNIQLFSHVLCPSFDEPKVVHATHHLIQNFVQVLKKLINSFGNMFDSTFTLTFTKTSQDLAMDLIYWWSF